MGKSHGHYVNEPRDCVPIKPTYGHWHLKFIWFPCDNTLLLLSPSTHRNM